MLYLTILTPDKTIFEDRVFSLSAPGSAGYFEILPDHAGMITTLQTGKLEVILQDKKRIVYAISDGAFEVYQNKAVVLATAIEVATEIDLERAKKAYERALKRLELSEALFDHDRAVRALRRANNRIDVHARFPGETVKR